MSSGRFGQPRCRSTGVSAFPPVIVTNRHVPVGRRAGPDRGERVVTEAFSLENGRAIDIAGSVAEHPRYSAPRTARAAMSVRYAASSNDISPTAA